MSRIDFDAAIAPTRRADFLARYWNRDFLYQPGVPGRFARLLDWDGLSRILERHQLEAPRLRLMAAGKALDPDHYSDRDGRTVRIDAGALARCLAQGAMIVLDGIERIVPAIGDLAESVSEALNARVTANLYAATHPSKGFDLHWDEQDVLILQLGGRKHWRVYRPTAEAPLRAAAMIPPPPPSGDPIWSGILAEGDMLYLPRGWWHAAEAQDEPVLHVTVTIVPPRGTDFLAWVIERLAHSPELRRDLPHPSDQPAVEARFDRIATLLADAAGGSAGARFQAQWMQGRPPRPHLPLPFGSPVGVTRDDTMLRLRGLRALSAFERDGSIAFIAGKQDWTCSPALVPALSLLNDATFVRWSDLADALPANGSKPELGRLVTALALAGVIDARVP